MNHVEDVTLADGRTLNARTFTYPIAPEDQCMLIDLYWTEWSSGDYDWLKAMRGTYSDSLVIQSLIAKIDGIPAGTASVNYPRHDPEVAVVGSVLTHPDCRRLRIAEHLTNAVTDLAFAAGCKVAYLGADQIPSCVYLKCGYSWHNGGVMRREASGCSECEQQVFSSGQETTIRSASWGDLPGLASLVVQTLDCCVIDYPRGYLSGKYVSLERCVSNFPNIYDQVVARGGVMEMLIGELPHRVLGFGTVTPEPAPARDHLAILDVVAHDNYVDELPKLIDTLKNAARRLGIKTIQANVADHDQAKRQGLLRAGFQPIANLPGQLNIDGRKVDVTVLTGQVN